MVTLWFLCVSILARLCCCANMVGHFYNRCNIMGLPTTESSFQNARTASECSVYCLNEDQCFQFRYDSSTKSCYTGDNVMAVGGEIYARDIPRGVCPHNHGYRIGTGSLCLKYYPTRMTQVNATKLCNFDGGHLVLVENETIFNVIVNLVTTNNAGQVWVDGFDEYGNYTYKTYRGDPLPYVPHNSIITDRLQPCIRLKNSSFRDIRCNKEKFGVICQIDLQIYLTDREFVMCGNPFPH